MADAILMASNLFCMVKAKEFVMTAPQLSVRSSKARDLAHRLARRENRTIADIVERALETYEAREAGREPASEFYKRISAQLGTDIDLDAVIEANRITHRGIEL